MTRIGTVALLTMLLGSSGCMILVPGAVVGAGAGAILAKDIRVKEGAAVQVSFDAPRDASLIGRGGRDTTVLAGTSVLVGRVREIRADTLWLTVSEAWTTGAPRLRYPRQRAPEVTVLPGQGVQVRALGDQVSAAVFGGLIGTGVAVVTFWVMCTLNPCFD